jgi:hypothetical protein
MLMAVSATSISGKSFSGSGRREDPDPSLRSREYPNSSIKSLMVLPFMQGSLPNDAFSWHAHLFLCAK